MEKSNLLTESIEKVIIDSLRKKFQSYKPETSHMPFHYRLLGKDRMALFSFIQSLNTTFGTSIFEPVAETLAKLKHKEAKRRYVLGNKISKEAQNEIQNIINELTIGKTPDKKEEIERIKKLSREGEIVNLKTTVVDLFVLNKEDDIYFFDIKTAKPNIGEFKSYKRTLLEWIAIYLYENPEAKVNSYIAIPYNPYEPKPYERWTLKGMLDLENELMVAEEFWNFLGGEGAYEEVLNCFERAGIKLRLEIDEYFAKFK